MRFTRSKVRREELPSSSLLRGRRPMRGLAARARVPPPDDRAHWGARCLFAAHRALTHAKCTHGGPAAAMA